MKRVLSFLLALTMVLTLSVAGWAGAEPTEEIEDEATGSDTVLIAEVLANPNIEPEDLKVEPVSDDQLEPEAESAENPDDVSMIESEPDNHEDFASVVEVEEGIIEESVISEPAMDGTVIVASGTFNDNPEIFMTVQNSTEND